MAKFIANIDVSGTAKADIFIGYKDTLSLSISFRNSITDEILDISASEIKLNINSYSGKAIVSITPTIASNVATFQFDTTFWAKLKNNDYDYTITKKDGAVTRTIMAGLFKPGSVAAGCGCSCDVTVDGVTPYTIEVTVGSSSNNTRLETVYVPDLAYLVTDDKLKGAKLFAIIYVEGAPIRYTQYGIDWDGEAGTLDFTGYGQQISGYIDFIIQD